MEVFTMIADKKVETVTTTTYTLKLTEEEMNTIVIAVGSIAPANLRKCAAQDMLEVVESLSDESDLSTFYRSLKSLVTE
jgi:vacuolar-type H+-ATPase subunit C/Vma6